MKVVQWFDCTHTKKHFCVGVVGGGLVCWFGEADDDTID